MTRMHGLMSVAHAERIEPLPGQRSQRPHWIVGTHHRFRTASFLNAFAFCAAQIWDQNFGPWWWAWLGLQFLAYPHLMYWRACRAEDTQRAELQNIQIDCFLVALVVAAMGFPLWPTFTLFISTCINNAIASGRRGTFQAMGLFGAGALLGGLPNGWAVTSLPGSAGVVWLCVGGLTWYLLGVGSVAYQRTLALRSIRERLKVGEQALQEANDALLAQLEEIRLLQAQLEEQAVRDPLTGLYNRRYLQTTMARELARCERENQPLSVMLIDLDLFKQVNDTHGHQVGDEVLRTMATLLTQGAREGDVPCRYGGEEFMLLLPGMPLDAARHRAELWRKTFKLLEVPSSRGMASTTLSIGLSCYPAHGLDPDTLIRQADQALYLAKAAGRDRVMVWTEETAPTTREAQS